MATVPTIRAAQYVRMSTDNQQFSIDNQIDAIRDYARGEGIEIVRTYSDPGRSGLTLKGRPGLQRLLADIANNPPFELIVVYDVSRWGRFQNTDEAAHYEFLCSQAGVRVIYCMEPFQGAPGITGAVMKSIKRLMAAEYSRELSGKVARGLAKSASRGYWPSGSPYGYDRCVIDGSGALGRRLGRGERKAQTERVTLVPGAPPDVALVRRAFHLYVENDRSLSEIAAVLDAEGWPTRHGRAWHVATIARILRSEAYVGTLHYRRTSRPLTGKAVRRPRSDWITVENAFEPLVDRALFDRAALKTTRRRPRAAGMSDDQMLAALADLHGRVGDISDLTIRANKWLPTAEAYRNRFGSMSRALALLGVEQTTMQRVGEERGHRHGLRSALLGELRLGLSALGCDTELQSRSVFALPCGRTVGVFCQPPAHPPARGGQPVWTFRLLTVSADVWVLARAADMDGTRLDFYLMDRRSTPWDVVILHPLAPAAKAARRFEDLDQVAETLAGISRAPTPA